MYKTILVPLDGSTFGEHALPLAISIARRANAQLILTHVHLPLAPLYLEGTAYLDVEVEDHVKNERQLYLEKVEERVRQADVPVTTKFLEGPVSSTLSDYAKASGSDLVVMTTHGRDPLTRFWLGSVADEMLRHCTVPMLLVHPGLDEPDLKKDIRLEHMMIALDGSEFAERMIGPAEELAKLMKADVTLFRAIEFIWPSPYPAEYVDAGAAVKTVMERVDTLQGRLKRSAAEYLDKMAGPLREHGLTVKTHVVAQDYPASAVLETAEADGCDALAIETHGRHGLSRMFLGSVADKIIRGTTLPVLVHRPEG